MIPVSRGNLGRILAALAFPCLPSCAAPIDAPSAFSGERYLCGPEHQAEFDALVEECRLLRQTSVCRGVLSVRGSIDSEEVTLDTHLTAATFSDWPGDSAIAREIGLVAPGPYFTLKANLSYFAVPPLISVSGALPVNCAVGDAPAKPCIVVNFEARGGNYLSSVLNVYRTVELEMTQEMRVSFTGDLGRGGHIEGCFHLLAVTS
jgi:hypothetical protein